MADEFDIQQLLQDQSDDFLMQNRQFAWIADSNNGSYSGGQVVLFSIVVALRIQANI